MTQKVSLDTLTDFFDQLLEDAEFVSPLITDRQSQTEKRDILTQNLQVIKAYKKQAVSRSQEEVANLFLYYQCAFNSKISHLNMCLSIKDENAHSAWNYLIDMQEYFKYAVQAFRVSMLASPPMIEGLLEHKKKLQAIEEVIFHKFPLYHSCGFRIHGGLCSICGNLIDICEHIEEIIYMGSVCKRILTESDVVELDHSSIVKNPKDRRCIVTKFFDKDGIGIDYITKKELPDKKDESENGTFEMVMFNTRQLDIF